MTGWRWSAVIGATGLHRDAIIGVTDAIESMPLQMVRRHRPFAGDHRLGPAPDRLLRRGSGRVCRVPRHLPPAERGSVLCFLFGLSAYFQADGGLAQGRTDHGGALVR